MSQGVCTSIERPSHQKNVSTGGVYSKQNSQQYLLSSPNKGSSRLFKNAVMCPPIGPKTLFSPVMIGEKSFQTILESANNTNSANSSARKKKQRKASDTTLNQKVNQAMQYYGNSASSMSANKPAPTISPTKGSQPHQSVFFTPIINRKSKMPKTSSKSQASLFNTMILPQKQLISSPPQKREHMNAAASRLQNTHPKKSPESKKSMILLSPKGKVSQAMRVSTLEQRLKDRNRASSVKFYQNSASSTQNVTKKPSALPKIQKVSVSNQKLTKANSQK